MKFKDIENKSLSELNDLLNDLRAESFTLGWKNKTQQQDQTHKIKLVRRDIARVLTAIKQQQLKAEQSNQNNKKESKSSKQETNQKKQETEAAKTITKSKATKSDKQKEKEGAK